MAVYLLIYFFVHASCKTITKVLLKLFQFPKFGAYAAIRFIATRNKDVAWIPPPALEKCLHQLKITNNKMNNEIL